MLTGTGITTEFIHGAADDTSIHKNIDGDAMTQGIDGRLLAEQIPRLRRYARALTRNVQTADDLVQDCLERAWRKAHHWEAGTDLRAWLFTLMHNVHINAARRKRPETEAMEHTDYADPKTSGADNALALRDLEQGLALLSPEQREVLLLVCLEDMTYEQVAAVTGVPIGTVMSRLHRARERMRGFMADERRPGSTPNAKPVLKAVK
jgi:RNA polymerase sigma-70 factor, ECF subfamily